MNGDDAPAVMASGEGKVDVRGADRPRGRDHQREETKIKGMTHRFSRKSSGSTSKTAMGYGDFARGPMEEPRRPD